MNLPIVIYNSSRKLESLFLPFLKSSKTTPFKPKFVSLELANTCCLSCDHCDIWKTKATGKKMSLEEMEQITLKLYKWLGFFRLNITGGEPFLNKDTLKVVKFASDLGIFTHANTNGYLFNKDLAQKVSESGINSLSFSLDSLEEKVHDKSRGKKGSYKRVLKALDFLNRQRDKKKLFVSLTTIIMKPNINELGKIVKWAKKREIESVFFQPLWQNFGATFDKNWHNLSELWPSDARSITKAMDELIKLKNDGFPVGNKVKEIEKFKEYFYDQKLFGERYHCFVGLTNFAIDIYGNVRLCYNFPPIGNILKESPEKIWNGKKAQEQRAIISKCKRGCKVLLCNN